MTEHQHRHDRRQRHGPRRGRPGRRRAAPRASRSPRPTVEAARAAAAEAMTAILAAVRGRRRRADATCGRRSSSVQPRYDYRDGKAPTLVGYDLANIVEVTARDLANLGAIIDGALSAGATSLDGLSFRVDDPREAERAARTAAVAEARSRAEILAEAAGVAIAGVADIVEGGPPPTWPQPKAAQMLLRRGRCRYPGRGRHDRDLGHGDRDVPDRLRPPVSSRVRRSAAARRSTGWSRRPSRPRPRRSN